jgi:hypothetical protein
MSQKLAKSYATKANHINIRRFFIGKEWRMGEWRKMVLIRHSPIRKFATRLAPDFRQSFIDVKPYFTNHEKTLNLRLGARLFSQIFDMIITDAK